MQLYWLQSRWLFSGGKWCTQHTNNEKLEREILHGNHGYKLTQSDSFIELVQGWKALGKTTGIWCHEEAFCLDLEEEGHEVGCRYAYFCITQIQGSGTDNRFLRTWSSKTAQAVWCRSNTEGKMQTKENFYSPRTLLHTHRRKCTLFPGVSKGRLIRVEAGTGTKEAFSWDAVRVHGVCGQENLMPERDWRHWAATRGQVVQCSKTRWYKLRLPEP